MKYLLALVCTVWFSWAGHTQVFLTCNNFEDTLVDLQVDSASCWGIGEPTKTVFNGSKSDFNSIVTKLDTNYKSNDTSVFYTSIKSEYDFPNYLGGYNPLEVEFDHRFMTDSENDYGMVEMSVDGDTWHDLLSPEFNTLGSVDVKVQRTYHYFEATGDTILDSIQVTGNSGGWVHSKLSKDFSRLVWEDSVYVVKEIILRFSFISDSVGTDEGWQIDNLCVLMDGYISVDEISAADGFSIYPNPSSGDFVIKNEKGQQGTLLLFNALGQIVSEITIHGMRQQEVQTDLHAGLYLAIWKQQEQQKHLRLVIH